MWLGKETKIIVVRVRKLGSLEKIKKCGLEEELKKMGLGRKTEEHIAGKRYNRKCNAAKKIWSRRNNGRKCGSTMTGLLSS